MALDSQDPLPLPGNLTRRQVKGFMRVEPITLGVSSGFTIASVSVCCLVCDVTNVIVIAQIKFFNCRYTVYLLVPYPLGCYQNVPVFTKFTHILVV